MKSALIILCLAVASYTALPTQKSQSSILDYLKDLEEVTQQDGKLLMQKMINLVHHIENGLRLVKDVVPKVHEKVHQEADEVLSGLHKIVEKIQEYLDRQKALFGFDLLGSLTELSGGTKLSTALELLSLAEKAHKVVKDAQEFQPRLESTLTKIQDHIADHVKEFANHVLSELGLQDVSSSVIKTIEDLYEKVGTEAHVLILDILHKMEGVFDLLEKELPHEFERVKTSVDEVRAKIHDLVADIEKTFVMRSFNLLDIAGDVSDGTSMGTVFKVMSLLDKFNKVVQDVREFEPRAERLLDHSIKKVADSAQEFFSHAAQKLLQ